MNLKKVMAAAILGISFIASGFCQTALKLYNQAFELQAQEDYFGAVGLYKEVLELNPQNGNAWYNLALCSYNLGNYDLSIFYAENAEKYSPNSSQILNLKGMSLISLGRLNEARDIFNSVLKKYPNNVEACFGLAELDLFEGKMSVAGSRYEEALKRDPSNRKPLLALALISSEMGNYTIAQKYINQALSYHSGDAEVHYLAAYLASQNGNLKEAEIRARSAVQIKGDYDKAYALLSQILFSQKRYTDVIDLCEFRTGRNRNLSEAWYLMGLAQEKINHKDAAIESFETGLAVNPEDEVLRLALEQLVSSYISIEDERRTDWASYHVEKAKEYSRNYDGPAERFEYQKALSVAPLNIDIRQGFAGMLERESLYELYLQQLKFIKENKQTIESSLASDKIQKNENSPVVKKSQIDIKNDDSIEALESLMKGNLSHRWNIDPFYLDKARWNIGIYYKTKPVQLIHSDLEEVIAQAAKDTFQGVASTSVDAMSEPVSSFDQAFRNARLSGRDYFVILTANETDRSFEIDAKLYSARTGTLTSTIHVYRTGNDRVAKCLKRFRQAILDVLPIRGKILKSTLGNVLIDLGKSDGVESNAKFDVVKKGAVVTNDNGPGIYYREADVLGSLVLTKVNEEIAEGTYTKKGFYDTMNLGDEVILIKAVNDEVSAEGNVANDTRPAANKKGEPSTNAAVKAEKESLKEDLKAHLVETELIRLIRDISQ